jgi:predicted dehydrogenase
MPLRAIVIGAGWAGEGHTIALRDAGVDVVAMCGRTPAPAHAMAGKLGIPNVRFDWRAALREFRPDIVAIATPAPPHAEMAIASAQSGCHVACDKPLAGNAADAKAMLEAVKQACVKHAYGATSRYGPSFIHARMLVTEGLIGELCEIEYLCLWPPSPLLLPFSWIYQLSQGGGFLLNGLPHLLAQVRQLTGGDICCVAGEARKLFTRAPVGPPIHDYRDLFRLGIDRREAEKGEWREVDADFATTVMARFRLRGGGLVSAVFQASARAVHPHPNYLGVHGTAGTLFLSGAVWAEERIQHYDLQRGEWEDIEVPQSVVAALPQVEDRVQRDWNQFYREFVADVRGEGYLGYPTFRDGWVDAEVAEIVRSGRSWTRLPLHPTG